MKRNPGNKFIEYVILVYATVVFGIYLTGADMAMGRLGIFPVAPTLGAVLTLAPLSILALLGANLSFARRKDMWQMLRHNLVAILLFMFIAIISLAMSLMPGAYWGSKGKWIFLNSYGFLIFSMAIFLPTLVSIRKYLHVYLTVAILAWLGSIITDLYLPGFFSTEYSRAAGFPGNSNFSALVGTMLLSARLTYSSKGRAGDVTMLVLVGMGVFCTLSRSGIINYLLLSFFYAYVAIKDTGLSIKRLAGFVAGLVLFIGVFSFTVPFIVENTEMFSEGNNRFSSFISGEQVDDGSADSRLAAAEEALEFIEEDPLLGHGTGFDRRLSEMPHNIYLHQWVNNGILSLLCFLTLLGFSYSLFRKHGLRAGQGFIQVVLIGGFFSHNILDQRTFLVLLAMLLTTSYYRSSYVFYKPSRVKKPRNYNSYTAQAA